MRLPEDRHGGEPQKSDRKRRSRVPFSLGTITAALLLAACQGSPPSRSSLAAWNLSEDLPDFADQIRELRLPQRVDRLDWLPHRLEILLAGRTSVTRLDDLPRSLRMLDVSGAPVEHIEELPASLVSLDLSWTRVESLKNLPEGLESLALA